MSNTLVQLRKVIVGVGIEKVPRRYHAGTHGTIEAVGLDRVRSGENKTSLPNRPGRRKSARLIRSNAALLRRTATYTRENSIE